MKSKSMVFIALVAMFVFAAGLAQAAEIPVPGTAVNPSTNFNYLAGGAGTKIIINPTAIPGGNMTGSQDAGIDAGASFIRWRQADGETSDEFPSKIRFEDMADAVAAAGFDMTTLESRLLSLNTEGKAVSIEGDGAGNGPVVILGYSITPPSDGARLGITIKPNLGNDYFSFISAEGVDAQDNDALTIVDGKVSSAGTSLWLTFSKSVFDFANPLQVNECYLTSQDVENSTFIDINKMTSSAFKVDGTAATGLSAPALLTDDTQAPGNKTNLVRFNVNTSASNPPAGGNVITFNAGNAVSDLAGNKGDTADTGATIQTLADPSAVLAELRATQWPGRVGANIGADTFDVWVFFSNELDATVGLAVDNFLITDSAGVALNQDGDATDDFITNAILGYQTDSLDVVRGVRVQFIAGDTSATAAQGVTTDAKTFVGGNPIYVAARDGAADITDIFGGTLTTAAGPANVALITDKTAPEISFVSSSDVDGDGRPDSIKFGTSEAITGTSSAGLHLETVGNTLDSNLTVVGGTTIDITSIGFASIDAVFDPGAVDWDGDGNAGTADTDGEATPGGGDGDAATAWGKGVYTASAGNIIDTSAASNAMADFDETMTKDGVGPVLDAVLFKTGDNMPLTAGFYTDGFSEQDNAPGDQTQNDIFEFYFSEGVQNSIANFKPTFVFQDGVPLSPRLGRGPNDIVASGSVVQIVAGTADGGGTYVPGSVINLLAGSGIADDAENAAVAGTKTSTQGTTPYVLQHKTISGATVLGAYALDPDMDGFWEEFQLNFNTQIDTATKAPVASNFEVKDFAGSVTGVTVGSPWIILSITDNILKHLPVTLVYTSNSAANQEISDGTNDAVDTGTVGIQVTSVEKPRINTKEVYTQDAYGTVTECDLTKKVDGYVVGCADGDKGKTGTMGSKVKFFGTRLIPTSVTVRYKNITAKLEGDAIQAMTNYFLGYEPYLYFSTNGECHGTGGVVTCEWSFLNTPSNGLIEGCCSDTLVQVSITSDGTRCTGSNISTCNITRNWVPATPPYISCSYPGMPTDCSASVAMVDNTGNYIAHISDERAYIGNPIIGVYEDPIGRRWMFANAVAGVEYSTSSSGGITFGPEAFRNKSSGALGPGPTDPAPPLNYNVDLRNMEYRVVYPGWNPWAMPRSVGYYSGSSSNLPELAKVGGVKLDDHIYPLSSSFNMNQTFAGFAENTSTGTIFIDGSRWLAHEQTLNSGLLTIDNKGVHLDDGVNTLVPPNAAFVYGRGYDPTVSTSCQIDRLFVAQYGDDFDAAGTSTLAIDYNSNNLGWYATTNWRGVMTMTSTLPVDAALMDLDYNIQIERGGPSDLTAKSWWSGCTPGTNCDAYTWPVDTPAINHHSIDTNIPYGKK